MGIGHTILDNFSNDTLVLELTKTYRYTSDLNSKNNIKSKKPAWMAWAKISKDYNRSMLHSGLLENSSPYFSKLNLTCTKLLFVMLVNHLCYVHLPILLSIKDCCLANMKLASLRSQIR